MRRFVVLIVLAVVAVAAAAPSAERPPSRIAAGVKLYGVRVGGLTSEQARSRVRTRFDRPLRFVLASRRWRLSAARLGAKADVDEGITRALQASPREHVRLGVAVDQQRIRRYVAELDHRFSYPAQDAQVVGLVDLRPQISEAVPGRAVRLSTAAWKVTHALRWGYRRPLQVPLRRLEPVVTREHFGPVIVIRRESKRLYLYDGTQLTRTFPVATGRAEYPTPLGTFAIVEKQRDPWWRPPNSSWARGLKPIPPGAGNPLGTRWMGTSAPGVGIHGTPDAASVGYSASHGCVRMFVPDAEWLFGHVEVGTPVVIVSA